MDHKVEWVSWRETDKINKLYKYALAIHGDYFFISPDRAMIDIREINGWMDNARISAELHNAQPEFFTDLSWSDGFFCGYLLINDEQQLNYAKCVIGYTPKPDTKTNEAIDAISKDGGDVIFVSLFDSSEIQAIRRTVDQNSNYEPLLWISDFRGFSEIKYDPYYFKIDYNSSLFMGSIQDYLQGKLDREIYMFDKDTHLLVKEVRGSNFYRFNEEWFGKNGSAYEKWKEINLVNEK